MDAIPFHEGASHEVQQLLRTYEDQGSQSASDASEVEFHVSACRLIHLDGLLVTPGGSVTNFAVMLAGYPLGTRHHHRLYLVEPHEVKVFPKWLVDEPSGFLTPLVQVKLRPQATMAYDGAAPPRVRVMVGRLPNVEHLVVVLGLRSLQQGR